MSKIGNSSLENAYNRRIIELQEILQNKTLISECRLESSHHLKSGIATISIT